MPQKAAGWRIEPPVSEPKAALAMLAATAAAEPPDDPPGTRSKSLGLRVNLKPEFSVELPIANSSILVLPIITAPASRNLRETVASYEAVYSLRILEPAVVGYPLYKITSFNAMGAPAK